MPELNLVRRHAKANWEYRITIDGKDIRRSTGTRNKKDALQIAEKNVDAEKARAKGIPRLTFEQAATCFLEEHIAGDATMRRYATSISMLRPFFTGVDVQDIGEKLKKSYDWRKARGVVNAKGRRVKNITGSGMRNDYDALSSMFTFLRLDYPSLENPIPAFLERMGDRLAHGKPRKRIVSFEEQQLIKGYYFSPPSGSSKAIMQKIWNRLEFFIETGLRDCEMSYLIWEDADPMALDIFVVGKGNRERRVPLTDRAIEIIKAEAEHSSPTGYIFPSPNGGPMPRLGKSLERACESAGIDKVVPHDLRRTCGCRLLRGEVVFDGKAKTFSMQEVSKWLGHSSISVTETHYAFLSDGDINPRKTRTKAAW